MYQQIVAKMQDIYPKKANTNKKLLFFNSLLIFLILFMLLDMDILNIVILIVVLIIHEIGHYLAMKFFHYKNVGIMFTPFGAVTIGNKDSKTSKEEFLIALAGPLPGILLSIGIFVYLSFKHSYSWTDSICFLYAMISLAINYINLLPIYPLDGAKILYALLLHRYPRGQFYFYLVSMVILVADILYFKDYLLIVLFFILAIGFFQHKAISTILYDIFNQKISVTKKDIAILVDQKYPRYTLEKKAHIAYQIWSVVNMKKSGLFLMIGGMFLYIVLLLPPLLAFSVGIYTYNL